MEEVEGRLFLQKHQPGIMLPIVLFQGRDGVVLTLQHDIVIGEVNRGEVLLAGSILILLEEKRSSHRFYPSIQSSLYGGSGSLVAFGDEHLLHVLSGLFLHAFEPIRFKQKKLNKNMLRLDFRMHKKVIDGRAVLSRVKIRSSECLRSAKRIKLAGALLFLDRFLLPVHHRKDVGMNVAGLGVVWVKFDGAQRLRFGLVPIPCAEKVEGAIVLCASGSESSSVRALRAYCSSFSKASRAGTRPSTALDP